MSDLVFYSWQSDLPNRCNRGFIQRALEQAIADLQRDADLEVAPRLDQDTAGVPGSPDISQAIFEKIEKASAFVADVSLLPNSEGRMAPNPNVLIELGYALKTLGSRRVIMVMNTHFGPIENLPFDLRRKRTLTYRLGPDTTPLEERQALRSRLLAALRLVFEGDLDAARQQRIGSYASDLLSELISFLVLAEQMEDRHLNPWFDTAQDTFQAHAESLRELAIQPEAEELEVVEQLTSLARKIEIVTEHRSALGRENWQQYLDKVSPAVAIAAAVKSELIGQGELSSRSMSDALAQLAQSQRVLASLSAEAQDQMSAKEYSQWERLRARASEEGEKLLRLSHLPLPAGAIDLQQLRSLARKLHQLELMEQRTMGHETIDRCLTSIVSLSDQLAQLAWSRD